LLLLATSPHANHFRKSFEPPTSRNFWLGNAPISKFTELIWGNLALCNSIEQMIQERRRNVLPPDIRHVVVDVEAANDVVENSRLFRGISGSRPVVVADQAV